MEKKEIFLLISSSILSIILANLGAVVWNENKIISIITILIAFISIYFVSYIIQIKNNEDKIKEIEEWKDSKEELLNTLKYPITIKIISIINETKVLET